MPSPVSLLDLQWRQLIHDESFHKDVVIMPLGERIKHFALHNGKYVGYLLDAIEQNDDARYNHVLTDAFIIGLACANTLNDNLGHVLQLEGTDLMSQGAQLAAGLGRQDADTQWFLREFARATAQLCKACESLDHLDEMPFRGSMREANRRAISLILAEAGGRKTDLAASYLARLSVVEDRSVFRSYLDASRGR